MHPLVIDNPEPLYAALSLKMAGDVDPAFLHRIHCLILLAQGCNCYQVGAWFSHSPRTIQRWVHHYRHFGVEGLRDDKKPGRLPRLDFATMKDLKRDLSRPPYELGVPSSEWNSSALERHLTRRFGVSLSRRQCLRWLGRLRPQTAGGMRQH
ncbi:helix-turn-helix domain-containing protein [Methylococcus sp. EFPC2]|uniref:helix-turn-helix domain-containing protein n=1 Tax=Methylococcus sp. EFPC2 TaxID=2812648 RepID=UPI001967E24D|nr:helix-turn-helix domain-containing protein [Methylococcus sp. EFPC2]QSA96453.1 helix-turn-helix domain containing protein [Methylococcus sp. EFPC2]